MDCLCSTITTVITIRWSSRSLIRVVMGHRVPPAHSCCRWCRRASPSARSPRPSRGWSRATPGARPSSAWGASRTPCLSRRRAAPPRIGTATPVLRRSTRSARLLTLCGEARGVGYCYSRKGKKTVEITEKKASLTSALLTLSKWTFCLPVLSTLWKRRVRTPK